MSLPDDIAGSRSALLTGNVLIDSCGIAALGDTVVFVGPAPEALRALVKSTLLGFVHAGGHVIWVNDADESEFLRENGVSQSVTHLRENRNEELPLEATRRGESLRSQGKDAMVILENVDSLVKPHSLSIEAGFEPTINTLTDASYPRSKQLGGGSLTSLWTMPMHDDGSISAKVRLILQRVDSHLVLRGSGIRPHLEHTTLSRGTQYLPKGYRRLTTNARLSWLELDNLTAARRENIPLPAASITKIEQTEKTISAMAQIDNIKPLSISQQAILLLLWQQGQPISDWRNSWHEMTTAVSTKDPQLVETIVSKPDVPPDVSERLITMVNGWRVMRAAGAFKR